MSIHILDASAIVAYVSAEPGGSVVRALLTDSNAICYAHTMNDPVASHEGILKGRAPRSLLS